MDFINYFSFKAIVKILCGLRVRLAAKRHSDYFYWSRLQLDSSKDQPENGQPERSSQNDVSMLLPPRRSWLRPARKNRRGKSHEKIASDSIFRLVMGMKNKNTLKDEPWGSHLLLFIKNIQKQIQGKNFQLHSPKIVPIRKTTGRLLFQKGEKQHEAYRCLTVFEDLQDRILTGCLANYIRDSVDDQLAPQCYAFRRDGRKYSYRTAVQALVDFRKQFMGKKLYVAECDVQKFFDVVNHDSVIAAYDSFSQCSDKNRFDPRARSLLKAYLDCYSFPKNLNSSRDPKVIEKRDFVDQVSEKDLRKYYPVGNLEDISLGLPQGGALSPVLANLVMDAVDRAVLSTNDPDLFYVRFCDDMVIVHPIKKKCQEALDRYLRAMELLRLPIHPLRKRVIYKKDFYSLKSKGSYVWKETKIGKSGSPWVSFLGHQIRYDGVVRVREESILKHQEKLNLESTKCKRLLKKSGGKFRRNTTAESFFDDLRLRMISMGVGKVLQSSIKQNPHCWLTAFQSQITDDYPAQRQLRRLDAIRGKILSNVKKIIIPNNKKTSGKEIEFVYKDGQVFVKNLFSDHELSSFYYGAPFSYYGVFKNLVRPKSGQKNEQKQSLPSDTFFSYSDL